MTFDEGKHNRQSGKFANKVTEPGQRASAPTPPSGDDTDEAIDVVMNAEHASTAAAVALSHHDPAVRVVFAGGRHAASYMNELAGDVDPVVRATVAQRWDLPLPAALEDDVDPLVAVAVASRIDIDDGLRARLTARPDVARYMALIHV